MKKISGQEDPTYAIIQTDYFGGRGDQYANIFRGQENLDRSIIDINDTLAFLGVDRTKETDQFDMVGLGTHRHQPDYLDKYVDMADSLGVLKTSKVSFQSDANHLTDIISHFPEKADLSPVV
ncbi:MAG: hypothetical protein JWO03_2770 [Bacteroidetes bacterium]|nr:hypothetical protein [Bacteroidota bacterium]